MNVLSNKCLIFVLLLSIFVSTCVSVMQTNVDSQTCTTRKSPCFLKKLPCPAQCPSKSPANPRDKICYLDCDSPVCKTQCKSRKPNCNGRGSACLDPRFVGADGIVFYFHGRRNEHFTLVSDVNLQINARFIGLRPKGRPRDYTWIQALGVLFDSHNLCVEATPSTIWDDEVDHLKLSYDGKELVIPEGHLSTWQSEGSQLRVERTSNENGVMVTIPEVAEISVNVVPVTKEDSRIHNYQIPDDDCFPHLEVQFKFYGLSSKVEGVLGRTYQPDFQNPAKPGVAMPVVGGEDKYRTTSLVSADCNACIFSAAKDSEQEGLEIIEYGMMDCTGGASSGNGIVCRR